METTQSPQVDILRNRAEMLTTAIVSCNCSIAKYTTALLRLTSGKAYFRVKVLNSDSHDDLFDLVILESEKKVVDLAIDRAKEQLNAYQVRRQRLLEELNSIDRQLSAMGSSDQVGE